MIQIIETKIGRNSVFNVYEDNIYKKTINVQGKHFVDANGKHRFLIYNSNMELIEPAIMHIEITNTLQSVNTSISKMNSLVIFYTFLEIIEKTVQELEKIDIFNFVKFCLGQSILDGEFQMRLSTTRCFNSAQKIKVQVMDYLRSLSFDINLKNSLLQVFSKTDVRPHTPSTPFMLPVPRFVSMEEYKKLLDAVKNSNSTYEIKLRDECIIRLMFEAGLRVGEVHGLTLEDIVYKRKEKYDTGEILEYGLVCIRNRETDKSYQLAKTVGMDSKYFQRAYISLDLYNKIQEYISLAHGNAFKIANAKFGKYKKMRERRNTSYSEAEAQAVGEYKKRNKKNYYLFLSHYLKPISPSNWNERLTAYYDEVGIPHDDNLNHKLRHGFAMHLAQDMKVSMFDVAILMRHRNPMSSAAYYNPTEEQLVALKEKFQELSESTPDDFDDLAEKVVGGEING